ncbi:hypothetical protein H0A66_18510 [Alcaligenaceae bacterium]|nr:hypothetical protein [Alcaligenaceae bacterium]
MEKFNTIRLAISLADYVNGVARRHAAVSQRMFPEYKIRAVTNSVHPSTWTSEPMRKLYTRYWPDWHHSPELLMDVEQIPSVDIWEAHLLAKDILIRLVYERRGPLLNMSLPVIGFARRMTAYKRANLLFSDLNRLKNMAKSQPFQIVLAGKAHPRDEEGKRIIEQLHQQAISLADAVNVALAIVSGSDVWHQYSDAAARGFWHQRYESSFQWSA